MGAVAAILRKKVVSSSDSFLDRIIGTVATRFAVAVLLILSYMLYTFIEAVRSCDLYFFEHALARNAVELMALNPLHIAALYASLDVVELLLSAGVSTETTDPIKQNALHQCAKNRSYESYLCAYRLLSDSKRLMRQRDSNKLTPLDLAIGRNNFHVISACLHFMDVSSSADSDIIARVYSLATRKDNQALLKQLDALRNVRPPELVANNGRTMLIWEAFFKSAFGLLNNVKSLASENLSISHSESFSDSIDIEFAPSADLSTVFNGKHKSADYKHDFECDRALENLLGWFSHVLIYDSSSGAYVFVDKNTGARRSFQEHINATKIIWCDVGSDRDLPSTTSGAMCEGWTCHYSHQDNTCSWLNIYTSRCEYYLPIGHDRYAYTTGGDVFEENNEWLAPDWTFSSSWMLVWCAAFTSYAVQTANYYFYNYLSGTVRSLKFVHLKPSMFL